MALTLLTFSHPRSSLNENLVDAALPITARGPDLVIETAS